MPILNGFFLCLTASKSLYHSFKKEESGSESHNVLCSPVPLVRTTTLPLNNDGRDFNFQRLPSVSHKALTKALIQNTQWMPIIYPLGRCHACDWFNLMDPFLYF